MWKFLLCGILLLVFITSVIVKIVTSQQYKVYMKYKNTSNIYKEKFQESLSNELVYQYIKDIDNLPKIDKETEYSDVFIEIYNQIIQDKNISNDLKFQLKVSLGLKGIRV